MERWMEGLTGRSVCGECGEFTGIEVAGKLAYCG